METLLSVGIDLGTTTTQMVVSELTIENTASAFSVPSLEIRNRKIRYRSRVFFTPLQSADTIDSAAVEALIRSEYEQAGITPQQVQTGAVIITGETARKENAEEVVKALSHLAGEFVVATAGPALESVLAAKGAGVDRLAASKNLPVLHIDIGGGTSNLALFDQDGKLVDTGCLNVGGRLLRINERGVVTWRSAVLDGMPGPAVGDTVEPKDLQPLLELLIQVLEEAAGLRPTSDLLQKMITDRTVTLSVKPACISFSGGVADLIEAEQTDWLRYGDIGVLLGKQIRNSRLCMGEYQIAEETIRATVIGAGCHSTELSGSTVFRRNVTLPMQNVPVIKMDICTEFGKALEQARQIYDCVPAIYLKGSIDGYAALSALADRLADCFSDFRDCPVLLVEGDLAKALGQAICVRVGKEKGLICLDGIHPPADSYLDIQQPVGDGCAVPVIVKTLAFES